MNPQKWRERPPYAGTKGSRGLEAVLRPFSTSCWARTTDVSLWRSAELMTDDCPESCDYPFDGARIWVAVLMMLTASA